MVAVEKKHIVEAHEPHWPSVWIWLGFLVVFVVAELALGWSLWQGHVWLACALVLLIAHIMHAHILAFHEAAHGTLCPSRFWNEAIGMLIGSLSFQGLTIFRVVHQSHHAYLGTERDEELWPFVVPGTARWVRCLIAIYELTLGITYTPILCFRTLLRAESPVKDALERRRIWAEYGLMACVWFVNLSLIGKYHGWNYFVCMCVAPGLIAGDMHSLRKYIEHMGLMGSTILSSTRSVVP